MKTGIKMVTEILAPNVTRIMFTGDLDLILCCTHKVIKIRGFKCKI